MAAKSGAVKKTAAKPKKTAKAAPKKKSVAKKTAKPVKTVAKKAPVKKAAKAAPKKKSAPKKASAPKGVPELLRDAALKILDERKAEGIVAVDLRGKSALADYALIATGNSARQLAAIADYLSAAFEKLGAKRVRVEGLPQGDWVLIDSGDVIIHLFRPEVRSYYDIESIWDVTSLPHRSGRAG
jgi:ribosome-associated protein